jgi:DNA-binding transcriptional MerR regulator
MGLAVTKPTITDAVELTALERLRLVGATEAGKLRGCHAETIRNLAKSGLLKSYSVSPGRRAFRVEDVLMLSDKT